MVGILGSELRILGLAFRALRLRVQTTHWQLFRIVCWTLTVRSSRLPGLEGALRLVWSLGSCVRGAPFQRAQSTPTGFSRAEGVFRKVLPIFGYNTVGYYCSRPCPKTRCGYILGIFSPKPGTLNLALRSKYPIIRYSPANAQAPNS